MSLARGLLAALVVAAAGTLGVWRTTRPPPAYGAPADVPRAAATEEVTAPFVRLGPKNAWIAKPVFRDVEVSFRFDPGPLSVLEVRLRAPDVERAEGVAFLVGTEPRVHTGFVRETATAFSRLGPRSDALRGRVGDVAVRLVARGDRLEAFVGEGEAPLAVARDRTFVDGGVVLVAARGEVVVRDVVVRARGGASPGREDGATARAVALASPWLLLALLAGCGVALGRSLGAAATGAAFGLAPFTLALSLASPSGAWGELWCGLLVACGVVTTLGVGLRAASPDLARLGVVAVAGVAAWGTAEVAFRPTGVDLDVLAYEGVRLEDGFLDLESAAVRAGMPWLARHRFAGVRPAPDDARPPVFVLGRSSGELADGLSRALGPEFVVFDGSAPRGGLLAARSMLDVAVAPHRPAAIVLADARNPGADRLDARHTRAGFRRTFVDRLLDDGSVDAERSYAATVEGLAERAGALGAVMILASDGSPAVLATELRRRLAEGDGG